MDRCVTPATLSHCDSHAVSLRRLFKPSGTVTACPLTVNVTAPGCRTAVGSSAMLCGRDV